MLKSTSLAMIERSAAARAIPLHTLRKMKSFITNNATRATYCTTIYCDRLISSLYNALINNLSRVYNDSLCGVELLFTETTYTINGE